MDTHSVSATPTPSDRLHDITSTQVVLGGISRSTVFELIRTGALGSVKIGRRRMVPQSQIDAFIARSTSTRSGGQK